MNDRDLFEIRAGLIRVFLNRHGFDGVLLTRADNFAMATGGKRNYVNAGSSEGACSLFVPRKGTPAFVGDTIEAPRILDEELAGFDCASHSFRWFDGSAPETVRREFRGTLVSDDGSVGQNVHGEMAYLRALLAPAELDKYRQLGKLAAEAMTATLHAIEAGMTEAGIAAVLTAEGARRRCLVPVCLIAADERIARYRHPLPTLNPILGGPRNEHTLNTYVMVVGCFQREGLVVSMTRFKRVDEVDDIYLDAYDSICGVDALLQEATRAGETLGGVFQVCEKAYEEMGFPVDEWHRHHQGGLTGYGPRTIKAAPHDPTPILDTRWSEELNTAEGLDLPFGHAFAWNPSAEGVKSEDTFLLHPDGRHEIVTETPTLPHVDLRRILGRDTDVVKSGMAI